MDAPPNMKLQEMAFYWNDHVRPEIDGISKFKFDDKKAEELRKAGFGVVNTHFQDGIARGTGVFW